MSQLVADWLLAAEPGESWAYHYGHLAVDRELWPTLSSVADALYTAAEHGFVMLVQRRAEPGVCKYLAYRTGELAG